MPPKRKATAAQSSSQPAPTAATPAARNTRKRRHSDASNVSSVASEAASNAQGPKRRKKGKQAATQAEPEIIVEEDEPVVEEIVPADTVEVIEDEVVDGGERHVHFSSTQQDGTEEQTTASHITPHPRKMTIKRRFTLSPSHGNGDAEATETRRIQTTRTSLPPSLSQDGENASTLIRELQFSSLRSVLEERIRRLKEHQKSGQSIDEDMLDDLLVLENEHDDIKYPNLSSSLTSRALQVIGTPTQARATPSRSTPSAFSRFRSFLGGTDTTTTTTNTTTAFTEDVTQAEIIENKVRASLDNERRTWDAERNRFQDAILALSHEAEEAKAKLRILTIELESFGFEEGTSTTVILQSIRASFESVRELFESELIGSLAEDASLKDIVELLTTNIKEFVSRLRVQDKELREKDDVITDLSTQVNGLLDHLAKVEVRKSNVEQQWRGLDQDNEKKSRAIEELEEELELLREESEKLQSQLTERTSELEILVVEKTEFEQTIEKLSTSLQRYRDEEARLTGLITRMEKDHTSTVASMNKEREETVQDLEDRLDEEIAKRTTVEKSSDELLITIRELETRVETIIIERDTLTETLVTVREERDAAAGDFKDTQADLEERDAMIEDLEGRVETLEKSVEEYTTELDELRRMHKSEHAQREKAEHDLDDRNIEIETLNEKLRTSGKEANELRQKLFQVQQQNKATVDQLEEQMTERDEQFQADMAAEVERRETANSVSQERTVIITKLETRLAEVEEEMRLIIIEKDTRIAELDALLIERNTEIQDLEEDLRQAEDRLDAANETHTAELATLEKEIIVLQKTISTHEQTIIMIKESNTEQETQHASELEDRDGEISELQITIRDLRTNIKDLETQRSNLERRVEEEAEQMLTYQATKADEIEDLQAQLREKQDKILIVQDKAEKADAQWQEVLEAREEMLREREAAMLAMRSEREDVEETVSTFARQNEEIKMKFRAYVQGAEGLIARLREALKGVHAVVDGDGEGFVEDGWKLFEEVEAMAEFAQQTVFTTTTKKSKSSSSAAYAAMSSSSSAAAKSSASSAKKGGKTAASAGGKKNKRVVDSGIGLEQPEMEEIS